MTARFAAELAGLPSGVEVTVTGLVVGVRKFTERVGLSIRDPFGVVTVAVPRRASADETGKGADQTGAGSARKNDRVRVTGILEHNADGNPVVSSELPPVILGNSGDRLADLSSAMREQASRILLAQAVRLLSGALREDESFVEFESRSISTRWAKSGLEPLHIHYPGFGGAVPLATSPAAQVTDIINTTGARRVFTVATSFSTTYRFPDAGAELRVIVGKVVDLGLKDLGDLLRTVLGKALESIQLGREPEAAESIILRHVQIPTADAGTAGEPSIVVQAVTPTGTLLAEGATEQVGAGELAGFTLYPSNLLTLLSATPARNLRDLRVFNVW